MTSCTECGGEVKQQIKPDAPEYIDNVCTQCGLIQETNIYHQGSPTTNQAIRPRKIDIDICLLCGDKLPQDDKPRGGNVKYFCEVCARKKRRKYQREWVKEKRRKMGKSVGKMSVNGKIVDRNV